MCNPPFYKDEQDIQDSFEAKEDGPSAVCQGSSNEMMTTGGEVQFVKQMVDESVQWQTRIRYLPPP
jgi:23S rRNA A1618 N6-methylase RlmF